MPTDTATTQQQQTAQAPMSQGAVQIFKPPRLPYHSAIGDRYNIDRASWIALIDAVFPLATSIDSVIMALSYCRARNLDPFKRPVHIVPVWNSAAGRMVDTVWPGIGELRTTAFRTKTYAGCDECRFGADVTKAFDGMAGKRGQEKSVHADVTFPEFAQLTVYRMIDGQRVAVQGPRVYWMETYASQGRSTVPNEMWQKRPRGQLEKCAEAAALRRAFPEEMGEVYAAEEMEGRHVSGGVLDSAPVTVAEPVSVAGQLEAFAAPEAPTEPAGEPEADPEPTGPQTAPEEMVHQPQPSIFTVGDITTAGKKDWPAMIKRFEDAVAKAETVEICQELLDDNTGAGRLLTDLHTRGEKGVDRARALVMLINSRKSDMMKAGAGSGK